MQGTHEEGKEKKTQKRERDNTCKDGRKRVVASEHMRERRKSPGGIMAWHGVAYNRSD
jgi:hypothetical protein